jgi:hypothetical protein
MVRLSAQASTLFHTSFRVAYTSNDWWKIAYLYIAITLAIVLSIELGYWVPVHFYVRHLIRLAYMR